MPRCPQAKPGMRYLSLIGILVVGLLWVPLSASPAHAASSWYVAPSGNDGNDCMAAATACRTIAAALGRATAGGTINIADGTYPERLLLRTDVTILGASAGSTIVGPLTIWDRGVTASVANVTVTGGERTAGGGIENFGSLILTDSIVSDNRVWAGEGYQAFGGGVFNVGTLTVVNSTIRDNRANGWGNDAGSGWGGGIHNRGTLTITGSTISGNSAHVGGGIYNAGAMTLANSTVSGNSAKVDGGGINTTEIGVTTLSHATVAYNTSDSDTNGAGTGGGLAAVGKTEIGASILGANNDGGGQPSDCAAALTSRGFNLIQSSTGCTITGDAASNRIGQDPRLGPLQNNGGATRTHALLDGSPAIDAASAAGCPSTDQRGVTRPQGTICDIGSFEYERPSTVSCPCSLWGEAALPAVLEDPDQVPVELGMKFRSDIDGYITGIRFYKSAGNTGAHTGTLWSSSGQALATGTFRNETASGWQELSFATPVAVTANTTYIASYHTDAGRYSVDEDYFAGKETRNGPLAALSDGTDGGNGLYKYGASGFPTKTYRASNYWVDVRFQTSIAGKITDLGTLGGASSVAANINNQGQIVGASTTAPGQLLGGYGTQAFVWQQGTMTKLAALTGGSRSLSQAFDVNDHGQIVGDSVTDSGQRRAVLWDNAEPRDLGTLGGAYSTATSINNTGNVVGYSTTASGQTHAFLWQDGEMTDLGTLGGSFSQANGINDKGQIVGHSQLANGETHAFLWQDGVMTDLGGFADGAPSVGTGVLSQANDINDASNIVGWGFTATAAEAALWRAGDVIRLDPASGRGGVALRTNAQGLIVGYVSTGTYTHAILWRNGMGFDPGTLGGNNSSAQGINNVGDMVGWSDTKSGERRAVLWSIFEPASSP